LYPIGQEGTCIREQRYRYLRGSVSGGRRRRKVGKPENRKTGKPENRKTGLLKKLKVGKPETGKPENRKSGKPESRNQIWKSRNLESHTSIVDASCTTVLANRTIKTRKTKT
jgi:hypothetical protein